VSTYAAEYAGQSGIQMSAVATAGLAELGKDLTAFVGRALSLSKTGADWTTLRTAAAGATEYAADAGFNFADMADFIAGYVAKGQDSTLKGLGAEILADIKAAVVANAASTDSAGLAVYLPNGSDAISGGYAGTG
ncbi:hypothetical protein J8J40_23080, partial [Mycobacterium tuberculosis]|nr:hypothetical protein [Mycobacterium tuberculosis]